MAMETVIHVAGTPTPQGSKKGFVISGRAVLVESSAVKLKAWRKAVAEAAKHANDSGLPYITPVHVDIVFWLTRPQKPKFAHAPGVKPDLDKLVRGVLDALVHAGTLADDSLVTSLVAEKRYAPGEKTGATISITIA